MPFMTSKILNLWISQKQKSRYLENETFYLLQIKKSLKAYFIGKNSFVAEVSFKAFSPEMHVQWTVL